MSDTARFKTVSIPVTLHEQLRVLSFYHRRPMANIIAEAVEQWAERNPTEMAR